jgi:hypothetical protein
MKEVPSFAESAGVTPPTLVEVNCWTGRDPSRVSGCQSPHVMLNPEPGLSCIKGHKDGAHDAQGHAGQLPPGKVQRLAMHQSNPRDHQRLQHQLGDAALT